MCRAFETGFVRFAERGDSIPAAAPIAVCPPIETATPRKVGKDAGGSGQSEAERYNRRHAGNQFIGLAPFAVKVMRRWIGKQNTFDFKEVRAE